MRELLRIWPRDRGLRVLLHVAWNPGDANATVTALPANGIGKPYRLMSELAHDDITPVRAATEEFAYPLRGLLEWLPDEGEAGEMERDALMDEIERRTLAKEISREDALAYAGILKEMSEEYGRSGRLVLKILKRHELGLHVVEP